MQNDAPRTIIERYAVAAASGCDLDMHMAAGMAKRHGLGLALLRLRAEFDTLRGEIARTSAAALARQRAAEAHQREAAKAQRIALPHRTAQGVAKTDAATHHHAHAAADAERWARQYGEMAEAALKRAPGEIINERLQVLEAMTTLEPAKRLLMARASLLATRRKFMHPDALVATLVGKVLDVHLDQTCHTCDGTGKVGNAYAGETQRTCSVCRGSGHRRDAIGADAVQRAFAAQLLADMGQAAAEAGAALKAKLRPDAPAQASGARLARVQDDMAD